MLFLSVCRLREIAYLQHSEITTVQRADFSGPVAAISAERMKGRNGKVGEHTVPLTTMMQDVLAAVPKFMTPGPYVFSNDGGRRKMGGFDALKRRVDAAILDVLREELGLAPDAKVPAEHVPPRWVFHDLRRTARSLLSRCGVDPDTAERTQAHKIGGVRGTYDVHDYDAQKFSALCKLSDEIAKITGSNVVALRRASA
jgi:integrase